MVTFALKFETLLQRKFLNPHSALHYRENLFVEIRRELAVNHALRRAWAVVVNACKASLPEAEAKNITDKAAVQVLRQICERLVLSN